MVIKKFIHLIYNVHTFLYANHYVKTSFIGKDRYVKDENPFFSRDTLIQNFAQYQIIHKYWDIILFRC